MIKLLSDDDLLQNVDDHRATLYPAGGRLRGSGTKGDPYVMDVGPLEFLLAIGRATSAILSDSRAAFNIASWWAVLRWQRVFDFRPRQPMLSDSIDLVRNHHMTSLSEDFGLGLSLLATEVISGRTGPRRAPALIDVDGLRDWNGMSRPDLIISRPVAGGHEMFVVEAKGTSSEEKRAWSQLRRGIDQVLAITNPPAYLRLVVCARIEDREIVGRAIAVDDDDSATQETRIEIDQDFDRLAVSTERGRLRRFAGLAGLDLDGEPKTFMRYGAEIVGNAFRMGANGHEVEIVVGVDRRMLEAAMEARTMAELFETQFHPENRPPVDFPFSSRESGNGEAEGVVEGSVMAADGCFLSIEKA